MPVSGDCLPTWEMLMKEPLEPADTMRTTLLVASSERCASLPESSRALFSAWFTSSSKVSSMVRPGRVSRSRFCSFSVSFFTVSFACGN